MTQVPLVQRFAAWSAGLAPDDVPRDVWAAARRAIQDTIGVTAAGGRHPAVQSLAANQPAASGPCSCVGLLTADAEQAALINGMAAHAWDFDDTSYTGIMHGSAVVFPAALALAEETGARESELIAAFVAGSEVTYVLADVATHAHYFKGWWSTTTFGLVGATAAAARLLGLSAAETQNALGLAVASASGGKVVFGTDGKPYLVGEAAQRAIGFARAAQAGLSGPVDAVEDPRGFLRLMTDGGSDLSAADSLGQRWRLTDPGLLIKTSPVCSAAHAAIEALAVLMADSGAAAGDIVSIAAEIPELVDISLIYPRPKTIQEAQFSLPYALACAALHGRVRLADLTPAEIASADKAALMAKVTSTVAADLSTDRMRERYPESARITVTLADGRTVDGYCAEARGMPARPLSDEELQAKFADCLDFAGTSLPDVADRQECLLSLASDVFRCAHTPAIMPLIRRLQ